MWESHNGFFPAQMCKEEGKASTLEELHAKLTMVSGLLSKWELEAFGHVTKELKYLNEKLERMRS